MSWEAIFFAGFMVGGFVMGLVYEYLNRKEESQ
jgi:hypothetical protein